jgi:hypothetical protein
VAVWLSRGSDDGLSEPDGSAADAPPPVDPIDPIDWEAFERELADLSRSREPAGVA